MFVLCKEMLRNILLMNMSAVILIKLISHTFMLKIRVSSSSSVPGTKFVKVRFQLLVVASMITTVFWDAALCSEVETE
jgi:uncharacterized membrane protein